MHYVSHNLSECAADEMPRVTVFCAVWHKQPDKLNLLRSHWENLKAQSIPVEPCYIFDNGDVAPDWLDAPWHSFSEPLSIYEAWSAGVALARTRYVMNLNMDDRLADNAVRALLATATSMDASLVGGDWKVRFDRSHLTERFLVEDLWGSEFHLDWPPRVEDGQRLGTGTGERGSNGPACLWDLEKIGKWYPCYFENGETIKSMGDAVFWQVLKNSGMKIVRLPMFVGCYYSDPNDQAEFRPHKDGELMKSVGVSNVSFADKILNNEITLETSNENVPSRPSNSIERSSAELAARYSSLMQHGPGATR